MPRINKYYCSNCGLEVKETDLKCLNCRNFLPKDGATKIVTKNVSEKEYLKLSNQNPSTISGWLAFFIITLLIINPIFNLFLGLSFSTHPIDIFLLLGNISLFILAGIFLLKKKPYAVQFTKLFLFSTFIFNVVFDIILSIEEPIGFVGIPYFIIWILYLYNSKRVKAIYGNLKENTSGYQIWPIVSVIYSIFDPILSIFCAYIALKNMKIHKKLKGKKLAIIALFIALPMLTYYFYLYLAPIPEMPPISVELENSCMDYCSQNSNAYSYGWEYYFDTEKFNCLCLDTYENVVDNKFFPNQENFIDN